MAIQPYETENDRIKNALIANKQAPQPLAQPNQGTLGLNPIKSYTNRLATDLQGTLQNSISAPADQKQYTSPIQASLPQAPTLPQAPQGLQAVEPLSQAGQIYKQRVTQNLLNPNPLAQSAQAQADTNMSRRNYLTQKQTQETMAQSPFGAGTRQYQRALMEGQAGANTANLGEQNQVNAYTRQLSDQAMDRAQGLEDTEFARALGERGYQDQNASRYSALIQDTKGRQAYNRLVASGVNPSVALQQILEEGGTIKEGYRGMSNIQQIQAEAGDWVQATQGLKPTDQGYQEAVRNRMIAVDQAQNKPLEDATRLRGEETATTETVNSAIQSGDYSQLIPEDYMSMSASDKRAIQKTALNQDGEGIKGDKWGHQDDYRASTALEMWKENNPALTEENIGKPIKYGENTYILTKPYELTGGKDNKRVVAYGINIRTGKEEPIIRSSEFDTEML